MVGLEQALLLGSVVLLIVANGLFVAAEFALVTARRTRIEQMAAEGNRLARSVLRAMDDPNRFISAAQIGITVASLGLGWLGEPALAHLFAALFDALPGAWQGVASHGAAVATSFILITFFHIIFGEQVPKMIAIQRAEGTILLTAQVANLMAALFRPAIAVIYWATELLLRPFGLRYQSESHLVYTVEELEMLVDASARSGQLETSEREMIHRLLTFADLDARQVMVPRTEMVAVPVDIGLPELMQLIARERRARYPVYDQTLDDIVGILHTKDLFPILAAGRTEDFTLRAITREAMTVPDSLPIDQVLALMKQRRTHIAIVIDEYGGTAGLITMEDLVERIVGQLQDEFERPEQEVETLPGGDVRIDGLMLIDEVNELFDLDIEDPNFDTIGGYVFGQLGRKPEVGDAVRVGNVTLRVDALDGLRIARLRVSRATSGATARDGE
ncbi:MAG: hemolysin family protein [Sphaerobacter sp.]|nr:hemolysin family protein [Sphaerobacter sp.]